jgi:lipoate-protein ligase A
VARPVGLLRALSPGDDPIASWSTTATPALVLGRSAGTPPVDMAAARAAGVAVVRRTSGGGPVLWDASLVGLDVILPPGHALAPADVVETYRWLGEAVAHALRALGLPGVTVVEVHEARAASRAPGPAAAACYGGVSPFEVLVEGRKVLGLSQARRRPGTLLQAGVLLDVDGPLTARLMGRDAAFGAALARHAAGLREWNPALGAGDVVDAVNTSLVEITGHTLTASRPTPAEQDAIAAAMDELAAPAGAG